MPKPTPTEQLIDRAFSRRLEIAALTALLEADEAAIVKLGAGKHSGAQEGHELTVVGPSLGSSGAVYYALPDGEEAEAQARELAGDKFPVLFDRIVTHVPIEGFEHVVPTHLTPAKGRDLILLCRKQGRGASPKRAYILWPKAGK